MPGQEKMVLEYYKNNPSASQSLKGSMYEEKILELIKTKIKLATREIESKEAEKIISEFNKQNVDYQSETKTKILKVVFQEMRSSKLLDSPHRLCKIL